MEVQLKSAHEMFEKLGYKLISYDDKTLIQYRMQLNYESWQDIVFNLESKTFWYGYTRNSYLRGFLEKTHIFVETDIRLLKAINKQIEELGWDE